MNNDFKLKVNNEYLVLETSKSCQWNNKYRLLIRLSLLCVF